MLEMKKPCLLFCPEEEIAVFDAEEDARVVEIILLGVAEIFDSGEPEIFDTEPEIFDTEPEIFDTELLFKRLLDDTERISELLLTRFDRLSFDSDTERCKHTGCSCGVNSCGGSGRIVFRTGVVVK